MSSYKELLQQRELLEKQIQEARKNEVADAINKVRTLIGEYNLAVADVFPSGRGRSAGTKVAAKYRNPETGETWTGRGKAPKWIQDQDRSKFEI